jgi:hypothetical protein
MARHVPTNAKYGKPQVKRNAQKFHFLRQFLTPSACRRESGNKPNVLQLN